MALETSSEKIDRKSSKKSSITLNILNKMYSQVQEFVSGRIFRQWSFFFSFFRMCRSHAAGNEKVWQQGRRCSANSHSKIFQSHLWRKGENKPKMVNAPEGNKEGMMKFAMRRSMARRFGTAMQRDTARHCAAIAAAPTCLKEQSRKIQNKSEKSMMKIERPDWAGTKQTNSE